ncbi:alpha/beta hydrolase [Thermobifida halotolerans]|uniref:Alpha/beta hydrolase n=1 Tax=Thermobifida halotolerans TaxID=483545 RepID=A0A399G1C6_9ACTN|nr:alpha/beta hydrolase [Thermobifida halotolerans]UOE19196.1 alpha/beta hydrolase [Thermobifida halotolerans]
MPDESAVLIDGPWTHRTVSAGGIRLHVVEAGEGPLVLLLHGFPQFWWAWERQITALAEAGYRAVAVDLRGYGASDKPPRGYDLFTMASDVAGLVRVLGAPDAAVAGHGVGGLVGWTMSVCHPRTVRRLAVLSAPHPVRLAAAVPRSWHQGWAVRHLLGFQVPVLPERRLVADGAEAVGRMLRRWSRPGWPDAETEWRFREAFRIPLVAHCSLECYRWLFRSRFRPDGYRYLRRMSVPGTVPTLYVHGASDPLVPPATARGTERYVSAPYRLRTVERAGHFPHQERPDQVNSLLVEWFSYDEPDA